VFFLSDFKKLFGGRIDVMLGGHADGPLAGWPCQQWQRAAWRPILRSPKTALSISAPTSSRVPGIIVLPEAMAASGHRHRVRFNQNHRGCSMESGTRIHDRLQLRIDLARLSFLGLQKAIAFANATSIIARRLHGDQNFATQNVLAGRVVSQSHKPSCIAQL